jgi:zinc D-Ala-D-Ala carboxypeptidase
VRAAVVAFTVAAVAALVVTVSVALAPSASADACYTWSRTLSQGAQGADVTELQVRVAGWVGSGAALAYDGDFGPATKAAVTRFQQAYGLAADGVAGPRTYQKIYELQDDDCTPIHFSYSEVDGGCGSGGYSGGSVGARTVKTNLFRAMWKAEALRHALGDHPLTVTSGFRSQACDRAVGGNGTGPHTYGTALDLKSANASLCRIAQQARYHGFNGIFGPGYPDHNDHVHVDTRATRSWSAPNCF